jgi:hypothetical protein
MIYYWYKRKGANPMEPTIYELVVATIIAVAGIIFLLIALAQPDDTIEIDDFKRRDIARREKEWK